MHSELGPCSWQMTVCVSLVEESALKRPVLSPHPSEAINTANIVHSEGLSYTHIFLCFILCSQQISLVIAVRLWDGKQWD